MSNISNKWSCSFCTYENFQASKKCALCDNEKLSIQLLTISSDAPIVADTPNVESNDNISTNRVISSTENATPKWSCSTCTYMNWPKSKKCVQCFNVRHPSISPQRASPVTITTEAASINGSGGQTNEVTNSTWDTALQKWSCTLCTYHNWPKASHCIMCKHPREYVNKENKERETQNLLPENAPSYISPPRTPPSFNKPLSRNAVKPWSEDTLRRIKMSCLNNHLDFLWLNSCRGAVEGDMDSVEAYLSEPQSHVFRKLTKNECRILNRPYIFEPGLTLVKLATRAGHEHIVDLLACEWLVLGSGCGVRKRMPCHLSPDLAREICHHFLVTLHQGKMDFSCYFVRDCFTFALPREIELLPRKTRNILLAQSLDINVQHELEYKEKVINWWCDNPAGCKGGERNALFALWNRTAGDCLLDSALQAVLGVLDRDNALRSVLTDSLIEAHGLLYDRWRLYEITRARSLGYQLDELQLRREWSSLVHSARQPGESLEHGHIFALAHIFRRPIIVYGVKYIHNNRAEPIGYANYQGVYLPLLWESDFCFRQPIVLGYTRGHFSALVAMETMANISCDNTPHDVATSLINTEASHQIAANYNSMDFIHEIPGSSRISGPAPQQLLSGVYPSRKVGDPETRNARRGGDGFTRLSSSLTERDDNEQFAVYLPLFDCHGMRLPIHFMSPEQAMRQEDILSEWLDISYNRIGLPLVGQCWRSRQHPLVTQMLDNWLHYYQQLSLVPAGNYSSSISSASVTKSDPASPTNSRKSSSKNASPSRSDSNVSVSVGYGKSKLVGGEFSNPLPENCSANEESNKKSRYTSSNSFRGNNL